MGQKVNPHGLELGIIKNWNAKWYADKNFSEFLLGKIRKHVKINYIPPVYQSEIERAANRIRVTIHLNPEWL